MSRTPAARAAVSRSRKLVNPYWRSLKPGWRAMRWSFRFVARSRGRPTLVRSRRIAWIASYSSRSSSGPAGLGPDGGAPTSLTADQRAVGDVLVGHLLQHGGDEVGPDDDDLLAAHLRQAHERDQILVAGDQDEGGELRVEVQHVDAVGDQ